MDDITSAQILWEQTVRKKKKSMKIKNIKRDRILQLEKEKALFSGYKPQGEDYFMWVLPAYEVGAFSHSNKTPQVLEKAHWFSTSHKYNAKDREREKSAIVENYSSPLQTVGDFEESKEERHQLARIYPPTRLFPFQIFMFFDHVQKERTEQ